jgi:hypothetical protein
MPNASKPFPAWVTIRFSNMSERLYPSYAGFIFNYTYLLSNGRYLIMTVYEVTELEG